MCWIEDKNKAIDNEKEESKYIAPRPYMAPIPFPQQLAKAKLDRSFGKFL